MEYRRGGIVTVCDRVIEIGAASLVLVTPFFFTRIPSNLEVEKAAFSQLMILVMLLAWLVKMNESRRFVFARTPQNLSVISLFVISAISLLVTVNISEGLNDLYRLAGNIVLFFILVNNIKEERQVRRIVIAMVCGGFFVAVHGNLQSHRIDFPFWKPMGIPFATFLNTNYVSQYLIVLIPVCLVMLFLSKAKLGRLFFFISSILLLSHLLAAVSKGAWVGTIASLGLMGLLLNMRRRRRNNNKKRILFERRPRFAVVCIVVIGLLCFGFLLRGSWDSLRQESRSFLDIRYSSHLYRLNVWEATAKMIGKHPVLGVGIGNFRVVYPRYRNPNEEALSGIGTICYRAHNDYLQIASEIGLVGLGVFMWFVIALYKTAIRSIWQTKDRYLSMVTIGLIASITATLVHALNNFNLQQPVPAVFFWFISGIIVAIAGMTGGSTPAKKVKRELKSHKLAHKIRYTSVWVILIALVIIIPPLTVRPFLAHLHIKKGEILFKKRRRDEAIQEFQRALKFQPSNAAAHDLSGRVHLVSGNHDEAINEFERFLELWPYFSEVYLKLGTVYSARGLHEKAIEYYEKALEISPNFGSAYHNMANAYLELRLLDEAVKSYKAALKTGFDGVHVAHHALGRTYARKGLYEKAVAEHEKAIKIKPGFSHPYYSLGLLYGTTLKDKEKAVSYLKTCVELDPDSRVGRLAKRKLAEFERKAKKED